jgi:UDP-N-acetylmuramoylalanine--D-glutamate ligase
MQRVSLFGYGSTTRSLAKCFDNVTFYDDKCNKPFKDEEGYSIKPSSEFDPLYSDLEIPSPGIAPSNPLIQKAQHLMSEYDYFHSTKPLKVWISGTNGKTTTTQMMQHLLKSKGSQEGGNIGTPLAKLSQKAPLWLLETSSFTMHYTNISTPNIYILLPLSPDHLSWHGGMQEYIDAKLKPLKMMKEGDIAIIPKEYESIDSNAYVISYSNEVDLAQRFGFNVDKIHFKGAFLLDALLAMSIEKILYDTISYENINNFTLEAHRQEEIRDKQNRIWVNDTKATNLDATKVALKRYEEHFIHLIIGGDDKGVDMQELFEFLKTKKVKLYTIGSNKEKLATLAQTNNISFEQTKNLLDAIEKIAIVLQKNEVALLSPAAASLDEFSSYAERGNIFKDKVSTLS